MRLMRRWLTSSALLALALAAAAPAGAQQRRIYIANDDHTDYLWSGDEAAYRQAFLGMIDYYLDLADATAGNPSPYQSRFNMDGSFWAWTYERNRTPQQFQRFIERVRDGHLSMPLTPLVTCNGGTPAEAVLRGLYYAGRLERRYGLRFPLAVAMENQTLPYGLGSLWAGAGARWSWRGICACDTHVPDAGVRQYPIYWWTGPDGSRILMKWYPMRGPNTELGGYAEARNPTLAVQQAYDLCFTAGYPYGVAGAFGKGWDDLQTLTGEFVTVAQSQSNALRQVYVSNEEDFFADFEATYGDVLPSQAVSFGNEWELYAASMSEVTASVRRAVERLRGAEALATLVSLRLPGFLDGRATARDLAFMDIGLYWEHDWVANGNISWEVRAAWQRRIASEIAAYVDSLERDAAAALGGLVARDGSNTRFFAFNPLGWQRSDAADLPFADTGTFHVIDVTTGLEVPSQIVTVDGQRRLRVRAADVPPVGYKVFEVRPGPGGVFSPAATVNGATIENAFYRLTVDGRGAITSLVDKQRGNREFAGVFDGRAVNDLGPGSGALQVEDAGPVTVTLRATASSPLAHVSRVTLLRDSRRIALRNDITQNFTDVRTWGFTFALPSPDVWHEEVGAVIRARLAPEGHYSPRAFNSRYDWLSLDHFADMSSGGVGVTLSNADLSFMRLGTSTVGSLDTTTPQISPLAGGQVNGPGGIPGQDGDRQFLQRFALQTHDAFDPADSMRFALEHQNPLLTGLVTGGTAYPAGTFSFLRVSDPRVLLWALKPAEEGIDQGVVARFWNLHGQTSPAQAAFAEPVACATRTTHVETNLEPAAVAGGALSLTPGPNQLQTFRVVLGSQAPPLSITGLAPRSGAPAGGAVVTITGAGFLPSPAVAFDGLPAPVLSASPDGTSVTVTVPPHASGVVDVVVTNAACRAGSLPHSFVYDFLDVPASHPFHDFVNALVRAGVTGGCAPGSFCPTSSVTREQMAAFLLLSKEGPGYVPPACVTAPFGDVPCSSPFAAWIQELVRRGVTAGCGGGDYCPGAGVTREQMAVFLLLTKEGQGYVPPACTAAPFADVPCSSPFAPWIQELVRRGVTGGCGGGNYCPTHPVSRAEMAAFLTLTFALPL